MNGDQWLSEMDVFKMLSNVANVAVNVNNHGSMMINVSWWYFWRMIIDG